MSDWRQISDTTRALLDQLYRQTTGLRRFTSARAAVATIDELSRCAEPAAIPELITGLFARGAVVRAAKTALGVLVRAIEPADLPAFDQWVRPSYYYRGSKVFAGDRWIRLDPAELARFGEAEPAFWGLMCMHASGYVRQAALGRLAGVDTGEELPFLLLRVNDWVDEVSALATRLVAERVTPEYAPRFVANFALVVHLREVERVDVEDLAEAIEELLRQHASGALLGFIEADEHRIARAAFRIATEPNAPTADAAIRRALVQSDVVLRASALRAGREHLAESQQRAILADLRHDPHRMVRLNVLRNCVEDFPDVARAYLREAVFDPSAANRQYARFYLSKMGEDGFAAAYREALDAPNVRRRRAALGGLGAIGAPEDAALILPFLDDASSKTRRIALRALADLGAGEHLDCFVDALDDPVASNSRTAADALEPYAARIDGQRLWSILEATRYPHVQRHTLRLITQLAFWDRIVYLLRAAGDANLRSQVDSGIDGWLAAANHIFTSPDPAQRALVERAVQNYAHQLAPGMRANLEELLRAKLG